MDQEFFQLCMSDKETVSDWGLCLSRYLQVLVASFPECFPLDCIAEFKCNCFYSVLPKWLKAMVVFLKASTNEKIYSDYLQAMRETEKEEAMEPSHNQMADNQTKPQVTSFFPLQKLKGSQPIKTPAVWLVHMEQDSTEKEGSAKRDDPNGIQGYDRGVIVHLPRTVKEAQQDEKCCYHCSSPEHFICECPLEKVSRTAAHLNPKGGDGTREGA